MNDNRQMVPYEPLNPVWALLATASMAASAYHGYRRNESIGWALWWGLMGAMFPVITPVIALAQGFGTPGPTVAGLAAQSSMARVQNLGR